FSCPLAERTAPIMSLLYRNQPTRLKALVCLPHAVQAQADSRHQVLAALAPYTAAALVPHQNLDLTLTAGDCDPFADDADGTGPLGLTVHSRAGGAAVDMAIELHEAWLQAVRGTPRARDLRAWLENWDHGDNLAEGIARFNAQPRIRAMRAAEHAT